MDMICFTPIQGEGGPTGVRGTPGQQGQRGENGRLGAPGPSGNQVSTTLSALGQPVLKDLTADSDRVEREKADVCLVVFTHRGLLGLMEAPELKGLW